MFVYLQHRTFTQGTDYLDACYVHDVEFVAEDVGFATEGGFTALVDRSYADVVDWGLGDGQEGVSYGQGDEKVLEAVGALFDLQKQGRIRKVGISGYPLPTLLRLARLIRHRFGRPLDILMSYSHHTLQNSGLASYVAAFQATGIPQIVNASALSMGLISAKGPQPWHPAPQALREGVSEGGG